MRAVFVSAALVVVAACVEKESGRPEGALALRIDELVRSHEALGRFSGAVGVAVDGETILARGYGLADRKTGARNTASTRFRLGSLTKQFTAAAILALEAEGSLRVEDAISTHLPAYPLPQGDRVTIHHLLSHGSGIPSLWRLGDGLEDVEPTIEPVSLDRLLGRFRERPLLFEPGARFRYSNSGYVVLAALVEAAAGGSYDDFLEESLFRPLGMTATGCGAREDDAKPYWGHGAAVTEAPAEHSSWSIGDGCVRSTVDDLLRWDAALRDERALPRVQREKLLAAHAAVRSGLAYGYGWFLSEEDGRSVAHHSGAGEGVVVEMHRYQERELSIVALANYAPELGVSAPAALVDQISALVFGELVESPPSVEARTHDDLARLEGHYVMSSGGAFKVGIGDGLLRLEPVAGTPSVFDFGELADPSVLERAAVVAIDAIEAGLAGAFDRIPLCGPLVADLPPGALEEEWRELLRGLGLGAEVTLARRGRYPGEDTLLLVTRVLSDERELYMSLDITPELEICGWYGMEAAEFAARGVPERSALTPLFAVGPDEFLADGFNSRENGVRVVFRGEGRSGRMEIELHGATAHSGLRSERAPAF